MQPLKRFTQCGSLTMLFAVFIVLFGVSSTALTTFGKSNNQQATHAPIVKGRECANHDDCAAILKTSCVKDPNDYKLRCLCGDDSTPKNGVCPNVLKGLHHKCNNINDCEDGMVCQYENGTIGLAKFMYSKNKVCICDNDNGYFHDVHHDICNGAAFQTFLNMMLSLISMAAPFIIYPYLQKYF